MRARWITFEWLEPYREFGPLFIRLAIGWHLVYGTQDNVFSAARMAEFRTFLAQHGFAYPGFMAPLSVYAQFICGLLFIVGLFTRPAAAIMVFNFIVALWMVHRGRPYPENALAILMLCGSLFLLFHGPGRLSAHLPVSERAETFIVVSVFLNFSACISYGRFLYWRRVLPTLQSHNRKPDWSVATPSAYEKQIAFTSSCARSRSVIGTMNDVSSSWIGGRRRERYSQRSVARGHARRSLCEIRTAISLR